MTLKILPKGVCLIMCLWIVAITCQAQMSVQKSGFRYSRRIDETTPITDQKTGKRISMKEYSQLVQQDPYAYHLVANYNEYGQPASYLLRPTTPEEHETRQIRDRDPARQPQAGQAIAPFSMKGLDEKIYRSTDLMGNVVVLCFLVSLDRPFWGDKQTDMLADALKPYQSETGPVVLGVMSSEQLKNADQLNTKALPFVPVLDGHGFHIKYDIVSIPTFVVIDKAGKVAANLQGPGSYEKLKQILATLTR